MGFRRSGFVVLLLSVVVAVGLAASGLVVDLRVLAAGGAAPAQTVAAAGPPNTVTVVGQGQAAATPDTATLTLGAAATRGSVRDALRVDATEMTKLVDALHSQGVVDPDIQTASVSVSQVSQCCPNAVTGYQASNSVTVTIHHLANVGPVIAAVVDAVGNDVTLSGVNLQVADTSSALKSARSAAMSNAAARAGAWAQLSGRSLGKLLSLSEVVSQSAGPPPCSGGCGGGGLPIQAGQAQIVVAVTATYQLDG